MLSMAFSWVSEDLEEGGKWLERVKGLGNVMMDMVSESKFLPFPLCTESLLTFATSNAKEMVRHDGSYAPPSIAQSLSFLLH